MGVRYNVSILEPLPNTPIFDTSGTRRSNRFRKFRVSEMRYNSSLETVAEKDICFLLSLVKH